MLEIGDGVFEVLATNGNTRLGGDDFDERIINYVADDLQEGKRHRPVVRTRWPMQRLKEAAEKAKIELSGVDDHQHQPALHHQRTPPVPSIWI